jgi:hypothetical protein
MPAKPIVALMPFIEWSDAEDLVDRLLVVGRLLDRTTARLSSWRCSRPSAGTWGVLGGLHQLFGRRSGTGRSGRAARVGDALGGADDR